MFCFFILKASPSLVLKPSQSCNLSPDPPPIESRIKQDKSDFEEQQRQRVAQEARAERRQKKKVSSVEKTDFWCQLGQTGSLLLQSQVTDFVISEQNILSCVCWSARSVSWC